MRRRPAQDEDDVSLFPFLSIIAAIIGVLTLMIAAVTISQLNQEDVREAVENSIEMDKIKKELAVYTGEVDSLKLQMGADQAEILKTKTERQRELVKTQFELNQLLEELKKVKEDTEKKKDIKIVIPEIPKEKRETVAEMQTELQQATERLAILKKQLDEKEKPPEEAEVTVLPGGSGRSSTPRFVECASDSLVMHTETPTLRLRRGEAAANPKFVALLEEVANDPNMTIIFLVREDGLDTYFHLRRICRTNDVSNGKLPAVGNGKLDFTHFKKQLNQD